MKAIAYTFHLGNFQRDILNFSMWGVSLDMLYFGKIWKICDFDQKSQKFQVNFQQANHWTRTLKFYMHS